ncbi:MAG: hypothetical protein L6R38_008969 [Xanthoria sp. 2 TBL-2021]|nr:MAG: hypothetical protein L6R38_008969 [Xanthoria sp. 2 TBL-2021]
MYLTAVPDKLRGLATHVIARCASTRRGAGGFATEGLGQIIDTFGRSPINTPVDAVILHACRLPLNLLVISIRSHSLDDVMNKHESGAGDGDPIVAHALSLHAFNRFPEARDQGAKSYWADLALNLLDQAECMKQGTHEFWLQTPLQADPATHELAAPPQEATKL